MPDCATCGGYISADFVRVFGDNDRTVRSCPSCRGTASEPASTEAVEEPTEYASTPSVSADGGERIEEAESVEESEPEPKTAPSLTADAADDDRTSDPVDDGQGTSTGVDMGDAAEPETAVAAGTDRSPLGFLRSVFLR